MMYPPRLLYSERELPHANYQRILRAKNTSKKIIRTIQNFLKQISYGI